jgi:predicted transcriptional regulator
MAKNINKIKQLDRFDHFLLTAINEGIGSCVYLANVSGKAKSTVSSRIELLVQCDLVKVQETNQKHFHVEYILTNKGQKVISNTCLDLNMNFINLLKV